MRHCPRDGLSRAFGGRSTPACAALQEALTCEQATVVDVRTSLNNVMKVTSPLLGNEHKRLGRERAVCLTENNSKTIKYETEVLKAILLIAVGTIGGTVSLLLGELLCSAYLVCIGHCCYLILTLMVGAKIDGYEHHPPDWRDRMSEQSGCIFRRDDHGG